MGAAVPAALGGSGCTCGGDLVLPGAPDARARRGSAAEDTDRSYSNDDRNSDSRGQDHVFSFASDLSNAERELLNEQMAELDLEELHATFATLYSKSLQEFDSEAIKPPFVLNWRAPSVPGLQTGANVSVANQVWPHQIQRWREMGIEALARSEVAVVLLPDGGSCEPADAQSMATADLGTPSHKSLLQVLCERLLRLQRLCARSQMGRDMDQDHKKAMAQVQRWAEEEFRQWPSALPFREFHDPAVSIPLYVMLNAENADKVQQFFQGHSYFGLPPSAVSFFVQESLPLFDKHGRIFLREKGAIWNCPDGPGGVYRALQQGGALADMKCRGIRLAYVMSCDNLLAKLADPVMIGYAAKIHAKVCVKCIERLTTEEGIGVLTTQEKTVFMDEDQDGDLDEVKKTFAAMIPPFELPPEVARRRDTKTNRLLFQSGDVSQYCIHLDTIEKLSTSRTAKPLHLKRVRVPYVSLRRGEVVQPPPGQLNAYKLESLLSDVFYSVREVVAWQVDRLSEYFPVQAPGDMADAASALSLLHQGWIIQAGGRFRNNITTGLSRDELCEVSPLVSYEGEDLQGIFPSHSSDCAVLDLPLHLMACGEEMGAEGASPQTSVIYAPSDAQATQKRYLPSGALVFKNALDHKVAQEPDSSERLCQTPRWLQDDVLHWRERCAAKSQALQEEVRKSSKQSGRTRSPKSSSQPAEKKPSDSKTTLKLSPGS